MLTLRSYLCKGTLLFLKMMLGKLCKIFTCSKKLYRTPKLGRSITLAVCFVTLTLYFFTTYNRTLLGLSDTRRFIEDNLKRYVLEEKGVGCKKPEIDPFSVEVMKFNEDLPKITCKGTDWVTCKKSECYVTKKILNSLKDISCKYRDIIYVNDQLYYLSNPTKVSGGGKYTLNRSDNVKISCVGKKLNSYNLISSRWYGYKAGLRPVKTKPIPADRNDSYNVMILAFDSASHNGFIRRMPKSYKFLEESAVILNGFNIIAGGTPAALFPILTGKPEEEHPDARKKVTDKVFVDYKSFIFHQLGHYGYRTAYWEDSPEIGTFQYRFNGFRRQPADHYIQPLLLDNNKNFLGFYDGFIKNYCVGDTPQYQVLLNLSEELLQLKGKKFCFTFIADISHDNFNQISTADEAVLSFLEALNDRRVFQDTLLIVMGDHGSRFSLLRETYQGKLEERLPLMAIILPEKLKQVRPDALTTLKQNADVLTTPFDVHTTLLDVLDLKNKSNKYKVPGSDLPRGMSLLEPIPETRTCAEAGIVQHWCACTKWSNVSQFAPMYKQVANALADYIDSVSEEQRTKCERRRLISIESVLQRTINNQLFELEEDGFLSYSKMTTPKAPQEYYQAKIIMSPGRGVFEGTMMYNTRTGSFTISQRDISRISAYGDEPKCVSATHPHLNPFCYCKRLSY